MNKIVYESVIVGIITSILGSLMIKILTKVNSIDNHDYISNFVTKYKKTLRDKLSDYHPSLLF